MPISSKPSGRLMEVKPELYQDNWNALSPMTRMESGSVMSVSWLHIMKAFGPMVVRVYAVPS